MKHSITQIKIIFLVILLIPLFLTTVENLSNREVQDSKKRDPLATYDIWDEYGKLHPEGPFTIDEFYSIVDDEIWFGYKKESSPITISDALRIEEELITIVLNYIESNKSENINKNDTLNNNFTELIPNLDRKGFIEKTDSLINQSNFKEILLKNVSNFFWAFEKEAENFPLTVLNSEIFYGKEGWIFSKSLSFCPSLDSENFHRESLIKLNSSDKRIIILPIPLKGQVIEEKLLPFQMFFIKCDEVKIINKNLKKQSDNFESTTYIDLYPIYSSNKNSTPLYAQGNTHWSDYGLSTALVELLSSMDENSINKYEKVGVKLANNEVLERLSFISLDTYEDDYSVTSTADFSKERILLIRDSFFENRNGGSDLKVLFDYDEIHWSYIQKISPEIFKLIIDSYSIIIVESSIENLLYYNLNEKPRLEILSDLFSAEDFSK